MAARAPILGALILGVGLGASTRPGTAQPIMPLVREKRWAEAEAAAATHADPVATRLVAYYRALTPGASSLPEIDAFRAANPDWPQPDTLRRRREEALLAEPDDGRALAGCDAEQPRDSSALVRCAAAYRRQGRAASATDAAREAWVGAASAPEWERPFVAAWGGSLEPGDEWARFDRLAWTDTAGAARQAGRLAAADRPCADARLALRRDDPKAMALLATLPPATCDGPALMLEQARWLRRARRDGDARDLWRHAGAAAERAASAEHRAAFWDERNLLARRRLSDGDAEGAYALAAEAAPSAPEAIADAAFLAGWIALRRLSDPPRARARFIALAAISRAAVSQARAHYWLARAAAAQGDAAAARHEDGLAAAYPSTYYGQLSALRLGSGEAALARSILAWRDPAADRDRVASVLPTEILRAGITLAFWGEPGRAAGFFLRASDLAGPADQPLLVRLVADLRMPETAVALARRAGRAGAVSLGLGWPMPVRVPPDSAVEPALALSVMRQESSFDTGTVSPAGARGLMQVMPATAAAEARRLGLAFSVTALTAEPETNIRLGAAYLAGLLRQFGDTVPLAVAAYNAGPSRVAEWLAAHGDPRDGSVDMVDWIELIPFGETRNYVQRVIENLAIYRARLAAPGAGPAAYPVAWHSPA